ncbi:sulfite reductase (ferredoxin) [Jatrophihabitans sp. GAS493]|uniref:nitrite/sulfite reductase n=1 Tax=Jatrophihabitans sp. GAS493 TaxID=1907575 RepID=UPI000BB87A4F|nr:nitrite/sulfite reductase [Jatrophihabitans sp. GAS493]SOD74347.1 sulfite reductase (ferredoxin) [Jatrophihabitans sp. GAS493]
MAVRRGQGQWALGYREPLNPNERSKRDNDGLLVRQRVLDIYQHTGFAGIDAADLRGRLRWYGLYTQRRPGIPGGRTAILEPEELEDEYFMMRIRTDGGATTSEQLQVIGEISTEFGRDVADITDRQNIQLHWIRIEDVPEIWRRLEAVGLNTTEACGDTPRVMLGCPLEGVAQDSVLDAGPQLRETVAKYVGDPAFSNLPRKFKTSMTGCSRHCTNHEINDVSFVGVIGPDGTPGFDLWVGGGLSTNPMFAQRLGVFVRPEEVSDVWVGVISIFRDYGYRRSRNHARLKFLVADWGPEKFREVLETEYLKRGLPDGPAPGKSPSHRDHVGIENQTNGRVSVGATTKAGRTSGTAIQAVAALAKRVGLADGGRVRLTPQQGLVVLDVDPEQGDAVADELSELGLSARPSVFHRGTMACTGIEFCKLALVETKGRAEIIRGELEQRLPDFDTPITINVNGCPNSCARFQIADIGFKGIVQKGDEGDVEAFQVHLGGQLGTEASFGRKFRGLKVTAEQAPEYAERVLRGYVQRRTDDESFASYVARAEEDWLL